MPKQANTAKLSFGRRRQSGFSLLELMSVVLVVGVLAALGVTNYRKTVERNRKENYTKAIAAMFRRAHEVAVGEGAPVYVGYYYSFLMAGNKYKLPSGSHDLVYAVKGVDLNGDKVIAFDNNHAAGNPSGEVTEIVGIVHVPYWTALGYRAGIEMANAYGVLTNCRLVSTNSLCYNPWGYGQAVIRPNGFLYGMNASKAWEFANFTINVDRYGTTGNGLRDRYGMVSLQTSGRVDTRF